MPVFFKDFLMVIENIRWVGYNLSGQVWNVFQIYCYSRCKCAMKDEKMNFEESRAYIEDAGKYGSVLGLSNMFEMMIRLGNPQEKLKIVHVAGTNGKGSVIAYIYSVMKQTGLKIGRYISPVLFSYLEKLEISGRQISEERFAQIITKVADVIAAMEKEGLPHPTPFEIETAAAFLWFYEENCDLVLMEVGMGGNLDATNIFTHPVLSILTSISMDHMAFLGDTLGEIAEKKAGILKKGCPMITASQQPEAEKVIRNICRKIEIPYHEAVTDSVRILEDGPDGQTFMYKENTYTIPLAGTHQITNAVLAIESLRLLGEQGFKVSQEQIQSGLKNTIWRGRFTIIHREPLFIVDGAHNPGAADRLSESVEKYFSGRRLIYITGVFKDKDYRYVLKKMSPYSSILLAIETPDNARALPAADLKKAAEEFYSVTEAMKDIPEAVRRAFELAKPGDVILSFGSLSFIDRVEKAVRQYSSLEAAGR